MTENNYKANICLIGGTGRCGTSLLSNIFNNHPDVATVPEWRFMIDPDGILDYINCAAQWSPYHVDIRIKRLKNTLYRLGEDSLSSKLVSRFSRKYLERYFPRKLSIKYQGIGATKYSPKFIQLSDQLIEKLTESDFAGYWTGMPILAEKKIHYSKKRTKEELVDIFRDYYLEIVNDVLRFQKAKHYLEKNTWNILWFDQILSVLPDARLIHIYRDPRDVIASFTQQSWMPSDPVLATQIYLDLFNGWQEVKERVPKDSYLEVSLEELSTAPEQTLNSVCQFWGIPWHSSLLNQDLSRSNSGRWKKQFGKEVSDSINSLLKEPLSRLGYER